MIQFDPAFTYAMINEDNNLSGIITSEPNGGYAKFGINSKYHPEVDLKTLTIDQAKQIFEKVYWDPYNFSSLNSQQLATKLFDTGINIGPKAAIKLLQEVLKLEPVTGVLDTATLKAIAEVDVVVLLSLFVGAQKNHYTVRSIEEYAKGKSYPLRGLLIRAAKIPALEHKSILDRIKEWLH